MAARRVGSAPIAGVWVISGASQVSGSRRAAGVLRASSVLDMPGCAATATVVPCVASRRCSSYVNIRLASLDLDLKDSLKPALTATLLGVLPRR